MLTSLRATKPAQPFNLYHLKYFCDLVELGSLAASARKNSVSQPAVTQAIQKLQSSLGFPLVYKQGKSLRITNQGMQLYERASGLWAHVHHMVESMDDRPDTGTVSFACTHSFAVSQLPKVCKAFSQEFPNVALEFSIGRPDQIAEWLRDGAISLGVVLDNDDFTEFESCVLLRGCYQLYSARGKQAEPLLLSEERPELAELRTQYRKAQKLDLPPHSEVHSWEVIAALAEGGYGMGFIPDYVAEKHPGLSAVFADCVAVPYRILGIHLAQVAPSKVSQTFLGYLQDHL